MPESNDSSPSGFPESANEELLSNSEDLQTLNEELQTSNEVVQSANEELQTLNHELLDRNNQLNLTNQFVEAIIDAIRQLMAPPPKPRREIGFHVREKAQRYQTGRVGALRRPDAAARRPYLA